MILIRYKTSKEENVLRIFGDAFVENNKDKCTIKTGDNEYELNAFFNI